MPATQKTGNLLDRESGIPALTENNAPTPPMFPEGYYMGGHHFGVLILTSTSRG